ncbi:MAG: LLM class flavin-dependent oxidoreductase [Acidimicrobiia bacterium]|nr:LLM class flavin-dependent oxidoreductase [Acidimicrobiia bacterium]
MRLGISVNSTYGTDARTGVGRMIERVAAADGAALDSLSFGDHHVQPGYVQNTPILARALADWGERPAGCLFLLPLWNPVLVAEHVVTLSGMMHGPFVLQAAIGAGQPQFAAMGAETSSRGRMLDESIRVIDALLAGDTVDSEAFGIEGAAVVPGPACPVEWWIAAGHTEIALRRAARAGTVWYGPPGATGAQAEHSLEVYREACADVGRQPRAALRRDVLITDDGREAKRLGDELIERGYRGLSRQQVSYGTAEQVAEELSVFADLGFDEVVIRCMSPDQQVALSTIAAAGAVRRLVAGGAS